MTGLSVVMANRLARVGGTATRAVAALDAELDPSTDELVWVDRAGIGAPSTDTPLVAVAAPPAASRGHCYGLGLAAARRCLVAFTDSTTVVEPGWRAAAREALTDGAVAVGGPVLAGRSPSRLDRAGFLVDYGPHAVPPYTSATGDVAGNNVAYRRDVLPPVGPVWKSTVDAGLRVAGSPPVLAPAMRVRVERTYRWADLCLGRARSGALYATQRSAGWSRRQRWLLALACAGLPALQLGRLWRCVRPDDGLRGRLLGALPPVVVATLAWSAGEAWAYVRPMEDEHDIW